MLDILLVSRFPGCKANELFKYITWRNDPWISADKLQKWTIWRWKWIFMKMLQIHSMGPKSLPNDSATPREPSELIFDLIKTFWATFLKSTSRPSDVTLAYTAWNSYFHGLQNMVGACSKWAFWCHHDRESKFTYSLEELPFQIFD